MGTATVVAIAGLALLVGLFLRLTHGTSAPPPELPGNARRGFLSAPRQTRLFDFENVIVVDERGTTEVDVIVVGNSGVFVVEIKDFNAWIFGDERDEKWTACYFDKSKHQFQNPLRQNYRHIKALQAQLVLPPEVFHSIIAFTGNCELRTPMPPNVVTGSYRYLIEHAQGVTLPDAEVRRICDALEELEAVSTPDALDAHVVDLRERFSSTTTCPRCGSPLVERRARTATPDEPAFLGCRSFPSCRFTRRLDAT